MKRFAFALILLTILCGCTKKEEKGIALAQVDKEILYLDDFKSTFAIEDWEKLTPETRKKYIEDWVNLTLLAHYADKKGLDKDKAVKQKISYAAKKVKANALIAKRLSEIEVSEDQLFNYFRLHQAEFQKNAVNYNIQRIALGDKIAAENVLQQLNQGLNFGEAVQRYSIEELKNKGGFMGMVSAGSPDSLFWLKARELQDNKFGLVYKEPLWYVFRVLESQITPQEANFEDYRAEIKRKVLLEKQEQVFQELIKEIKAQSSEIYYY